MNVKQLIEREICQYRSTIMETNLQGSKGKEYHNAIAIKKMIEDLGIEGMRDENTVKAFLEKYLPSEIYFTNKEREVELSQFLKQVLNYANWESRKLINTSVRGMVDVKGEAISVKADLILEDVDGEITVALMKRKAPKLTYAGRKIDTDPKQSMELYLLQKLGEGLYPDRVVNASIIYLVNKDKKVETFEKKKGANIIAYRFQNHERYGQEILKRMEDVISNLGGSEKRCADSECTNCRYSDICNYTHIDNSRLKIVESVDKGSNVELTYRQKEFTKFIRGFARVNAVAGSGKTTAIARRFVELVKNELYLPSEFLFITFTEKGAVELREKISFWCNHLGLPVNVDDVTIRTFNGFGGDLIAKEYKRLGFKKAPKLLDKMDEYEIILSILDEEDMVENLNYKYPLLDMFKARGAVVEVSERIKQIKSEGYVYPDEYALAHNLEQEFAEKMFNLFFKFQEKLKEKCFIQYQDQISSAIELLSDSDIVEKYDFRHITVDEFQDTDSSQMYIIKKLVSYSKFSSLVVCGDDSQSIFSWRGTSQENILKFHEEFDGTKDFLLNKNFRSTVQISSLANYINKQNSKRIDKEIVSVKQGKVPLITDYSPEEVADLVAQKIDSGVPKYEIGIIARTNSELVEMEKVLSAKGIDCQIVVTELLIDNPKVKKILSFSKFLEDNSLDLHFAELLQALRHEEFSKTDDLKKFVSAEKNKFLEEYLPKDEKERLEMVMDIIRGLSKQDRVLERFIKICENEKFQGILDFISFTKKMSLYKSDYAVEKDGNRYDAVLLTTAHASKGREFDHVIVLLDKFSFEFGKVDKQDEERRVLFVAITRAKENLVLISRDNRNRYADEVRNGIYHVAINLAS